MKVLVPGGTGYIGSHTCVELLNNGHEVVVIDDLSNSHKDVLKHIKTITNKEVTFYQFDAKDYLKAKAVFEKHDFDAIIHFAGFKAVGESVLKPIKYYENNVGLTLNLVRLADEFKVKKFIFSSSATVYGNQKAPFDESMPLMDATNPYGETKKISERILKDYAFVNKDRSIIALRYFNPIGAHESGLIGEIPQGIPNNLMPYITQVAKGIREKLFVYGNDYETIDGTGVRDYIHVVDLAVGHVKALNYQKDGFTAINLGSGKGESVLEIVKAFESKNKIHIPYEITDRRPGDIDTSYASVDLAYKLLGFKTTKTLDDMVKDSWNFEKNLK